MALAVRTLVFDTQDAEDMETFYVMEMRLLGRDWGYTACASKQGGALFWAPFIFSLPTHYKCN